jgi:GNAT superfamily N-acetyltransferase
VSADEYEIVRYRPDLRESVARLHSVQMPRGDNEMSSRYLAWKYSDNPYISEPLIYLALSKGEPVAMRGFFGSCWEAGDANIIVPCASDLVVAPEHQNRGLIAKIMKHAFADLESMGFTHAFSLSAGDVAAMSARALGFKSVAKVETLVRMRRFTMSTLLWRLKGVAGRFADYESIRLRVRRVLIQHPTIVGAQHAQLKRFDEIAASGTVGNGLEAGTELRAEAMAGLVARLGRMGRIRQTRDAAYLRWRYASPPREYRFVYSGRAELDGYLALSTTRGDHFPAVRIADWEGLNLDIKRRLLVATIKAGRFSQIAVWRFAASEKDLLILRDCGFVPDRMPEGVRGQGIGVFVKTLSKDHGTKSCLGEVPIFERDNWDYRMIYSDFV